MIIITNDGLQRRDTDVFGLTWLQDWKQRETASQALVELNNCESQDCAFCFLFTLLEHRRWLCREYCIFIITRWECERLTPTAAGRNSLPSFFFFFFYPDAAPMSAGLSTCICMCLTCKCFKPKLQFELTAYQVHYLPRGAA